MTKFSAKTFFCAAALAAFAVQPALATGAFGDFGGSWKGLGRISDKDGKSESLSCKSNNNPSSDGIAMAVSLVCASDSYRVDFHLDLYTDGSELRGKWRETTRDAEGEVSGQIGPSNIVAKTTAPGFEAIINIKVVAGKKLDIDLRAHGTSIDHVTVSMRH